MEGDDICHLYVQIKFLNKLILIIMMVILYREWWKAVDLDGNSFMIIHDNCTMGIAVVHLEEPSRCKFPRVQPRQCLGESSGSPTVAATATRHHSGRTIHRPAPQARHESGVWQSTGQRPSPDMKVVFDTIQRPALRTKHESRVGNVECNFRTSAFSYVSKCLWRQVFLLILG